MNYKTRFCTGATTLAVALATATGSAQAAKVELEWDNPDERITTPPGTEQTQLRFQERVVEELEEQMRQTAAVHLPTDQTLKLTIENVDVTENVEYFFTSFDDGSVRVVRDVYFPGIEFSYELVDENGDVLESGEENIRTLGLQHAGSDRLASPPIGYERQLIESWIDETF